MKAVAAAAGIGAERPRRPHKQPTGADCEVFAESPIVVVALAHCWPADSDAAAAVAPDSWVLAGPSCCRTAAAAH